MIEEGQRNMATNGRVLTKELDNRLRAVEERLAEVAERLAHLDGPAQPSNGAAPQEPDHQAKMADLEAHLMRLDERVQKITTTIVEQASRFS